MARVNVVRHMAADPASVALLLAEPPAERGDDAVVVAPPRRSGVGFCATVRLAAADATSLAGEVIVAPAVDAGCDVRIVLHVPTEAARVAERAGSHFLRTLADRACSRSYAA